MQIPKINWQNVKTSLQNTGDYAWKAIQGANNRFDEFVSSKNYDPKTVKQVGLGAAVGVAGLAIVISCIKGIVNSIKEKVEEK